MAGNAPRLMEGWRGGKKERGGGEDRRGGEQGKKGGDGRRGRQERRGGGCDTERDSRLSLGMNATSYESFVVHAQTQRAIQGDVIKRERQDQNRTGFPPKPPETVPHALSVGNVPRLKEERRVSQVGRESWDDRRGGQEGCDQQRGHCLSRQESCREKDNRLRALRGTRPETVSYIQGYLAHKKHPSCRILQ